MVAVEWENSIKRDADSSRMVWVELFRWRGTIELFRHWDTIELIRCRGTIELIRCRGTIEQEILQI